jgi:lipid-binding SYLF domain-containing protein
MDGTWGAPVMYALDQASLGIQVGSAATDFVLVVMHNEGVDAILDGNRELVDI